MAAQYAAAASAWGTSKFWQHRPRNHEFRRAFRFWRRRVEPSHPSTGERRERPPPKAHSRLRSQLPILTLIPIKAISPPNPGAGFDAWQERNAWRGAVSFQSRSTGEHSSGKWLGGCGWRLLVSWPRLPSFLPPALTYF